MRNYEVILHVRAPNDLEIDPTYRLRFLSKAEVEYDIESITELDPDDTESVYDLVLGCPCCGSRNTVRTEGENWICNDDDVVFTTEEGIRPP